MTHTQTITSDWTRQQALRLVQSAPIGYVVTVREAKRTTEQNDLMWTLLTALSIAKPNGHTHTPDEWKLRVMHACGHECQFETGLNGKPFPVGFRSSKLSKAQMSDLIEWIYAYAAEAGVSLGEPKRAAA
jgi:hypothetical protein